jgi:hypothetical protein
MTSPYDEGYRVGFFDSNIPNPYYRGFGSNPDQIKLQNDWDAGREAGKLQRKQDAQRKRETK